VAAPPWATPPPPPPRAPAALPSSPSIRGFHVVGVEADPQLLARTFRFAQARCVRWATPAAMPGQPSLKAPAGGDGRPCTCKPPCLQSYGRACNGRRRRCRLLLQAHGAHIELVTAKVEKSLLQDTTADLVSGGRKGGCRCLCRL
jgi:hypothetical protein